MPLLHNVVAQLAAAPELMPRYSTIIMDINVFLVAGLVPNCLKVISDTVYIRSTSYEKQKEGRDGRYSLSNLPSRMPHADSAGVLIRGENACSFTPHHNAWDTRTRNILQEFTLEDASCE